MKIEGCHALVTGASAGIGREFARQLTGRARSIVLVARRRDRLEQLRDELIKRDPKLNVQIRAIDLAERAELDGLTQWLDQQNIEIDLLINNAGLGDMGAFATSDPAKIERIILVNILALTILTRRLLPGMIKRKRGAILNVSSSAGFLPIAGFSVYAASKAYVTSFSEGLRAELRGSGVGVSALCPGPVQTEFTQIAQRPGEATAPPGPEIAYVSAEDVAREGLAAVERDRPLVIPGLMMKIGMFLVRLTPMPILRLASQFSARRYQS
jgi:short-subunit dehydrogenase